MEDRQEGRRWCWWLNDETSSGKDENSGRKAIHIHPDRTRKANRNALYERKEKNQIIMREGKERKRITEEDQNEEELWAEVTRMAGVGDHTYVSCIQ